MENTVEPYLSIVLAARNDNYGGDFNERLENTVTWLSHWIEHYRIPVELIIVNYNPLEDMPSLEDSINWPGERQFLQFRILTVPDDIHQALDSSQRKSVPLHEFIAKNAGIRRAKGQFILATNADILFHPRFFAWLAQTSLDANKCYRVDRVDFHPRPGQGLSKLPVDQWLAEMRASSFKFFVKGSIVNVPRWLSFSSKFWWANRKNELIKTYLLLWNQFAHLLNGNTFDDEFFVFDYHCNASGDFMLMNKDSWRQLRGYAENTWISTHTDSLLLLKAIFSGLQEEILPTPIFHQHHERRYSFDEQNDDMDRMYERLVREATEMFKSNRPLIHNSENWGMAEYTLKENIL